MALANRVLAILALLALAGCAALPPRTASEPVQFELSARLAVRYQNEASSGKLAWRHAPRSDDMLITSSLGQGIARIVRRGGTVTLTGSNGRVYQASDAQALTEEVLGFRVPLGGLADWVRGRAAPGPADETRGPDGRLAKLAQDGWRIDYLAYDGSLPARLRLVYPGIELRLAIDEWVKKPGGP